MKAKKTVPKARPISTRRVSAAKLTRPPVASKKAPAKASAKTRLPKLEVTMPEAAEPRLAKRKVIRRTPAIKLPAMLLEGDTPATPPLSGPGQKYALGPTPPARVAEAAATPRPEHATAAPQRPAQDLGIETGGLPEAYGTKRLFLTARDPHWLYAHWDLTREQQARYNRQSADGHLILRIHFAPPGGGLALEAHVHPESRYWFAHVERAATQYTAEVGWYNKSRKWTSIARSGWTFTPPESVSDETGAEFATIPADLPFEQLVALVKAAVQSHQPLALAVAALRREGHPDLPAMGSAPAAAWTPAQERALAEVVSLDQVRRVWIGSLEITELLRRELRQEISSQSAAQLGGPRPPASAVSGGSDVTSPFRVEQPRGKGFWFNVNAELIIYGATERDATVTIGGRRIKLRPDGSFSYRFALPDGRYDLPVVAVSADETDGRAAELRFTRTTELLGDVGASPQDPALQPPTPDDV